MGSKSMSSKNFLKMYLRQRKWYEDYIRKYRERIKQMERELAYVEDTIKAIEKDLVSER